MKAVTQIRNHQPSPSQPEGHIERLIDAETERLVIGNILARGREFWNRVGPQLTEECFVIENHRRVFRFVQQIAESGGDPTLAECYRAMIDAGKTAGEMGLPVLSELAWTNQVEIANPEPWVRALRSKAAERRAWRVAENLRLGLESGVDAAEGLSSAREELRQIEGSFETSTAGSTIMDAVSEIGVDTLMACPRGTVSSPWPTLNNLTNGGPRPGEFWIIGARPSVGKTTAALQWALTAAAAGQRVLFASLEMPRQDLLKRVLSAEGNIPHNLLVRGDLDRAWRLRVAQTLDRIGSYPLEISDKLRTLPALVAKVASTPGLGLLVVDYLGLVEPSGRYENRNQEVSAISRRLKLAALDYGVPIIAAHQLSRANESENRRPQLSDLRDSGSLEQDADVVTLLDAPATRKRAEDAQQDAVEMLIAKQRNGVRGRMIHMRLEGQYCRMTEADGAVDQTARRGA
jgi:replicative DNA helicase